MEGIRIGVLGQLVVTVDGRTIPVTSRAQRLVIMRLAISGGAPVSVDAVADAIWGEDLPKDPTNATRYHVWQLRSLLGANAIETAAGAYRLAIDDSHLDAHEFGEFVASGTTAADPADSLTTFERALRLWRGQPYLDASDAEFAQPEVRRLTELHRAAREGRARALVDLGRTAEAIPELEGMLEEFPHSEASWSALMTALYRAGRQADALRAYQRARSILGEDLGIEPTADLRDLEERVLLQDQALRQPERPRTNLPLPLTSFVGRSDEIRTLSEMLATRRLVSIIGVGGAGKTRLAIETARALDEEYTDGVWVADLTTSMAEDDPFDLLADLFGLSAREHVDASRTEVLAFLNRRHLLLILDNCEHLLEEAADVVTNILERSPDVRLLTTSRSALHVPGEAVFAIPVLGSPSDGAAWDDVVATDSAGLFLERATDAGATIEPSQEHADALVRICRVVEGMPLAIELAAARTRTIGVVELATELERHLDSFGELRGTGERHRTMAALIQWSFELLDEDAQTVFARLGVFAGGFTPEAAEYLGSTPDVPSDRIDRILDLLVDRSMVERTAGRSSRHRLLEPFRLYAIDVLASTGRLEEVEAKHAEAYFTMIVAANAETRGADRNEIYASYSVESANIRAALQYFERVGDHQRLCTLVAALSRYWISNLRLEDQRRWGLACLPYLDEMDDPIAAGYIHVMLAYSSGSVARTIDRPLHMRKALELARETDDELALADFLVLFLGQTDALAFGELLLPGEDEAIAEQAIDIYRRHGDQWGLVDALIAMCVAKLWFDKSATDEVITIAAEARRVAEEIGYPDGVVYALVNEAAARMGDPLYREQDEITVPMFAEMLRLAEHTTTPEPLGDAMDNYAWFLFRRGETERAADIQRRLASLADDVGMLYRSVASHTSLAMFLEDIDLDEARRSLIVAFAMAEVRAVDRQTVWVVEVAARILQRLGSSELAARLIGAADTHRRAERNQRPNWDLDAYSETVERIRGDLGERYDLLYREGEAWSVPRAADRAASALGSST